jgi:hypothetical protein
VTSTDGCRDPYGKARVDGGRLVLSRNKVAVGEPVAEKDKRGEAKKRKTSERWSGRIRRGASESKKTEARKEKGVENGMPIWEVGVKEWKPVGREPRKERGEKKRSRK